MLVVLDLRQGIQSRDHPELFGAPVRVHRSHRERLTWAHIVRDAQNVVHFASAQAERGRVLAGGELERQHAHSHQIRAMNPLERRREDRFDAQPRDSLRRPIARRAGAVLPTGDHDERHAGLAIFHRRVVHRHLFTADCRTLTALRRLRSLACGRRSKVQSIAPLLAAQHQIFDANIRERAAHQDLVIAAPRAVLIKVLERDATRGKILTRRRIERDAARRRNMVCRHPIAKQSQDARPANLSQRLDPQFEIVEERRLADVRGRVRPSERLAAARWQCVPQRISIEDVRVASLEHRRLDGCHRLCDFFSRGQHIAQVHRRACSTHAQRLGLQINRHGPSERVGDDQMGRGEKIRAHLRMDAPFEISIARDHGGRDQIVLADRTRR